MAKIIQQSAQRPHTPDGSFVESLERVLKFYTKWSGAMCPRLNLASLQLCSDPPNVLQKAAGFCFNSQRTLLRRLPAPLLCLSTKNGNQATEMLPAQHCGASGGARLSDRGRMTTSRLSKSPLLGVSCSSFPRAAPP